MYDGLTARYTFPCPTREEARIRLSSFRTLERLPGAAHPAVYGVRFSCNCGEVHSGLVSQEHVDVPFYSDREVEVIEHVFARGGEEQVAALADELASGEYGASRR